MISHCVTLLKYTDFQFLPPFPQKIVRFLAYFVVYIFNSIMSNTSSNITIVTYHFTTNEKGFLIGTFGLTLILTLVGNLVVILVESISKKASASIRAYHISMACADILLATFPFPVIFTNLLLSGWPHFFPLYFCPMARFMQSLGEMGSTLTLSSYALERYIFVSFNIILSLSLVFSDCNNRIVCECLITLVAVS